MFGYNFIQEGKCFETGAIAIHDYRKEGCDMEKNDLLRLIAPCGLLCYTCDAMKDGVINQAAKRLLHALASYDSFLESSPGARPISKKYSSFKEVLEYLANVKCNGCREDRCLKTDCIVPECTHNRNILFCYECEDFPCDKTGFPDALKEKWIRKNKRIKEVGIEQFFEEEKEIPHYFS